MVCSVSKNYKRSFEVEDTTPIQDRVIVKKLRTSSWSNDSNSFLHFGEVGVVHNIFSYLDIKEMIRNTSCSKKWKRIIETMAIDTLDVSSSSSINPDQFSNSLRSILKFFRNVRKIDCRGQHSMKDREMLSLISCYWSSLEEVVLDYCQDITDHSLHAILDSSSSIFKSVSFRGCKKIIGIFDPTKITGRLPLLNSINFEDTSVRLAFVDGLEKYFPQLNFINVIHTPAHHQFFIKKGWENLIISLANLSSRNDSKHHSLMALLQEYKSAVVQCKYHSSSSIVSKSLLSTGKSAFIDVPLDDDDMSTALMLASEDGHCDTIKSLKEHGNASSELTDKDGATALFLAAGFNRASSVETLLNYKVCTERSTICRATPLYIASEMGHHSIVNMLLQQCIKSGTKITNGVSAFQVACRSGYNLVVEVFLNHETFLEIHREDIKTALFMACENGHDLIVNRLLQHGKVFVSDTISDNVTPVYLASQMGHSKTVKVLIEWGCDVNCFRHNGVTSLYIASQEGHADVVSILLKAGACINTQMKDSATALHIASRMGAPTVVQLLLQYGASINAVTHCGLTPLFIACQEGHDAVVELLLQRGADLEMKVFDGATPLFVACQKGYNKVVEKLLAYSANPHSQKNDQSTPLHVASQLGHVDIVRQLLNYGAQIDVITPLGGSALHFASRYGHQDIFKILLNHWLKGTNHPSMNALNLLRTLR